jgi:hypothetical protein
MAKENVYGISALSNGQVRDTVAIEITGHRKTGASCGNPGSCKRDLCEAHRTAKEEHCSDERADTHIGPFLVGYRQEGNLRFRCSPQQQSCPELKPTLWKGVAGQRTLINAEAAEGALRRRSCPHVAEVTRTKRKLGNEP